MDRYISLRYKGLGAAKVNRDSIRESTKAGHVYLIKSTVYMDKEYEVDTQKWTCTCTVAVIPPTVISREIYLHDDVTFFVKWLIFVEPRCVWSRRPEHFILDASSKLNGHKKSIVMEVYIVP